MPATATDFESEISALLDELAGVQSELLAVLDAKRRALATADVSALTDLAPREEQLASRLVACQERRAELLAAADREGLPSESVAKLAKKASPGKNSKLGSRVKDTAARLRLLQHQSLANWVLAQRSLLHVSQLLEIIATGGRIQPTYGERETVHACGSLVNQEA
jgi:flagellar biosynthesis/type III secretory pathway chaperone